MSYNDFDELYQKIKDRLDSPDVSSNGDEISAYMLSAAVKNGMGRYYQSLICDMSKFLKSTNQKIKRFNFLKRKNQLPYLNRICPGVRDTGDRYIDFYFTNGYIDGSIGKATIDENFNITTNFFRDQYNQKNVEEFLKTDMDIYQSFFSVLDDFREQYPGVSYQWNNEHEHRKERIDDGFNTVYFNLDDAFHPIVSLTTSHDTELARFYSRKYGELYDYFEFYPNEFMRKIKVNINDLNPLYQTIVKTQMKAYGDSKAATKKKEYPN